MQLSRFVILVAAAAVGLGLRVEDAGRWDWQRQTFGDVTDVSFSSKRVYVGGEGVVGAVGKTGNIIWRRQVKGTVGWVKKVFGAVVVVGQTGWVQVFSEDVGMLLWDAELPVDESTTVLGISGETGEEWPSIITSTPTAVTAYPIHIDNADVKFGTPTTMPYQAAPVTQTVANSVLYTLSSTGQLHELQISNGKWMPPKQTPFTGPNAAFTYSDTAGVFIYADGKCYDNGDVFETNDITSCTPGRKGPGAEPTQRGFVEKFWAVNGKMVVKYQTGDLEFFTDGVTTWLREDGLGKVTQVLAYDLPSDTTDDAEVSDAVEFAHLITHQIDSIKNFIADLPKLTQDAMDLIMGPKTTQKAPQEEASSRENTFGLQKTLILYSERAVYSLDTRTGATNWQIAASGLGKEKTAIVKKVFVMLATHVQHSHPKIYVWVRSEAEDLVVEVSPETGVVTVVEGLKVHAGVIFKSENYLVHGYPALIVVGPTNKAMVFPRNAEKSPAFDTGSMRYHTFAKGDGVAKGFTIAEDLSVKQIWATSVLSAAEELVITSSLENYNPYSYITTDVIYVHGNHSTGKNEVLNKYVNPNAFVVITAVPQKNQGDSDASETSTKRDGYLVLYLIDGVTGSVLTSMVQPNAAGHVSLVAYEHMYFYTFLNTKRRRYQLGVWSLFKDTDLYKGMTSESTTSLKYIAQAAVGLPENTYSSFEEAPPVLIPSAFTFPGAVKTLAVTVSEKGVATKQLLASLATDEIVTIDIQKHIIANTQQGNTLISWLPTSHMNYNSTLHGITSMNTFPTKLESTCLVIGFGTDVFFSRTTSGKPFDMLPEDFEYTLLSLLTILVLVTTVVLWMLSKRETLVAQWA
eukprot:TRINITY_DN2707_c6_g1_i1.p1 TRINITY_DN2707_c6_g1~~TRINITY_DN2707_c6_g1_i1.p1  ORF type:complete len:857 (+),score=174.45 TRINITY_DN2707_c6_g1_i1:99-2669(+)